MSKIVWESDGKAANGEPFLTVKKARDYFYYTERAGRDSVAFIIYDAQRELFGLIKESKPPMDESKGVRVSMITAAGGSLDGPLTPKMTTQQEILEEMGIVVPLTDIHYVGKTMVSTQMSQMVHCFIADATNRPIGESEEDNELTWMTYSELLDNADWKSIYITTLAKYKGLI